MGLVCFSFRPIQEFNERVMLYTYKRSHLLRFSKNRAKSFGLAAQVRRGLNSVGVTITLEVKNVSLTVTHRM
ncbi:hypothetical protein RIF29_24215 [Crotalaria pallida]|uniref:Uncharacterized protein n=1 Tax=Crotalaria pallida TaxID=3830 RepID=A0AAN9EK67_CROPI